MICCHWPVTSNMKNSPLANIAADNGMVGGRQKWPPLQHIAKLKSRDYCPAVVSTLRLIRWWQRGECRKYACRFKEACVISVSPPPVSDERWELAAAAYRCSPLWFFSASYQHLFLCISTKPASQSKLKIPGDSLTAMVPFKVNREAARLTAVVFFYTHRLCTLSINLHFFPLFAL